MKFVSFIGFLLSVALGLNSTTSLYQEIFAFERDRSLGSGALVALLDNNDPRVAARAALALGRTKQTAAIDPLLKQLNAADPGVRAMTVYALGLLASRGAPVPPMVHALDDDAGAVRIAAADALARAVGSRAPAQTVDPSVRIALTQHLGRDPVPSVRARSAVALATFGKRADADEAAAQLVHAFLAERDTDVRWHEMWAVYRAFAQLVPREFLARALRDREELVRLEAVRAYGRLADPSAAAAVVPLENDRSWRVAEQARETVRVLQGGAYTDHWTHIPAGIHTPKPQPMMLGPAALPRPLVTGTPGIPPIASLSTQPALDPRTPAMMDGPMPGEHPAVRIRTTQGAIVLDLYPEWAPTTVANFLALSDRGYYDGLRWFRVVPDFVAQTGDPTDSGDGDAGYMIGAEENPLEQRSGVISMGLNYDDKGAIRDSAGTQFYITMSPQLHLDADFTVFGAISAGFDVLGRLTESDRIIRIDRLPDVNL